LAKAIFTPPSPETIKAVHDIVAGITGFSEQRGDQIVVETLPFQSTTIQPVPGPAPVKPILKQTGWREWLHDTTILIAAGVGGALVLILVVGVLLLRRKRPQTAPVTAEGAKPAVPPGPAAPVLPATEAPGTLQEALAARALEQASADKAALAGFKVPIVTSRKSEVLVKELRQSAKKDASVEAAVLQTWISGNQP
jgi:flagellar biosynthesis/type III secretory pathway M-ring protein FliF/YscJ